MQGILLLSHGTLCQGMLDAMEVIGCSTDQVKAIPLFVDSELDAYTQSVTDAIDELDTGDGVLVIVDVVSGTPFNRASLLFTEKQKHIEVVAGMNLAMCITALDSRDDETLESLAQICAEAGKDGILNVSSLLV